MSGDNEGPPRSRRTRCLRSVRLAGCRTDGEIDHLQQELSKAVVGVAAQRPCQGDPCQGTVPARTR